MMTIMKPAALAAGALALAAFGAGAQKVYRCGPDGRIYQQTACAEGKAVDASDPRTAEQRQAAQAVAKSEAATAAKFDRDMAPAPAPKGSKGKADAAPAAQDKAASGAKSGSKKADAENKPLVYLVPKPKDAASAAK